MAVTPVLIRRWTPALQIGQEIVEGLTARERLERTFPNPISKLMFYLYCVDMILDLSSIPDINEFM